MRRPIPWLTAALVVLLALTALLRPRPRPQVRTPASSMSGEPTLMLWAWETPQDLRALDVNRAGVAYLSRELLLGSSLEVRLRHQPLLLPPNVFLVPVVRIETAPGFNWQKVNIAAVASQIAQAAQAPNTRALQVDFDAVVSEHPFYAAVLRDLRRQLPPQIALSVTALTSWCGHGSWLHGLPVDEAVPMFFRMEPGRHPGDPETYRIREPLCQGSAGLSTTEPWPDNLAGKRLYIFPDNGWQKDLPAELNRRLP